MVNLSDHISWKRTRTSGASNNVHHVLVLSTTFVICFSISIILLFIYALQTERVHVMASRAFHKGVDWCGSTLVAFIASFFAALDVDLFVAGHHANHLKAIFSENNFHPIILPAVNNIINLYNSASNYLIEFSNAIGDRLHELKLNWSRMRKRCVGSLSSQLQYCLMETLCEAVEWLSAHPSLVPEYIPDRAHDVTGIHWRPLTMVEDLEEPLSAVSDSDILQHLSEALPNSDELLILHLRDKISHYGFTSDLLRQSLQIQDKIMHLLSQGTLSMEDHTKVQAVGVDLSTLVLRVIDIYDEFVLDGTSSDEE
ncbi:unnamed protein product [Aureobasidium vineae]|uniref:Uncharacterized protein n=1 Tax=Aureobasidium vineae TaxID=2773715 RepID=A0A9N8JP50_9PEZI|nr:unnamed protein product [Aureobasidium vineae]